MLVYQRVTLVCKVGFPRADFSLLDETNFFRWLGGMFGLDVVNLEYTTKLDLLLGTINYCTILPVHKGLKVYLDDTVSEFLACKSHVLLLQIPNTNSFTRQNHAISCIPHV